MTDNLRLSALDKVADAATQGDWRTSLPDDTEIICGAYYVAFAGGDYDTESEKMEANAAHIAAFDPPTAKRLLAVARAAIEYRDSYENPDKNANADAFTNLIESMEGVEL